MCFRLHFSFKRTLEHFLLRLSTELLPSFKIATINQEVLKDATSNFMDDFFFPTSPTLFPSAPSIIASAPSIHPCSSLISAWLIKGVSQWPLTYSYRLTPPSFNVSIAQTGYPIPHTRGTRQKNWNKRCYKLYLNLRGKILVLDFSDNGGLWLLSQHFNHVTPHARVVTLGSHFHFAQCRLMEEVQLALGVRQ